MNERDLIKGEGKYKIEVSILTSDGYHTIDYDGVIYASYFSARFNYDIMKRIYTVPSHLVHDSWIRRIDTDGIVYR